MQQQLQLLVGMRGVCSFLNTCMLCVIRNNCRGLQSMRDHPGARATKCRQCLERLHLPLGLRAGVGSWMLFGQQQQQPMHLISSSGSNRTQQQQGGPAMAAAPLLGSTTAPLASGPGRPAGSGLTGALAKSGRIAVPEDFDWRAYLLRYSDLRSSNIRTREAAIFHYVDNGYNEQRSYQRVPVLLRYTACQGLFNQMYAHLNALVLAEFLGADVVLPPSVYRWERCSIISTRVLRVAVT